MLTRADLDLAQCANPLCDHMDDDQELFLHSACHPQADVQVYYDRRDGCLHVLCAECDKFICDVKVAPGPTPKRRAA